MKENLQQIRKKFLENGIPFDDLDIEMIDIINVLNFKLNLKTEFCCYGHESFASTPYVVFDECVTDEDIYKLAQKTGKILDDYIFYYKWVRSSPVLSNWILEFAFAFPENPNCEEKMKIMKKIVKALEKCKVK